MATKHCSNPDSISAYVKSVDYTLLEEKLLQHVSKFHSDYHRGPTTIELLRIIIDTDLLRGHYTAESKTHGKRKTPNKIIRTHVRRQESRAGKYEDCDERNRRQRAARRAAEKSNAK